MRKLLVIMTGFPGLGGQTRGKIIKFLPEFGVEPLVITNSTSEKPRRVYDPYLGKIPVVSVGCINRSPFRLLSKLFGAWETAMFLERLVFLPDLYITMVPGALRAARRQINVEGIKSVFTSSPPESAHLVGIQLQSALGVKWIADFRDLWTTKKVTFRPPTRFHEQYASRLERQVYSRCDHLIANTVGNRQIYVGDFGVDETKITTVTGCFDPEELERCRQEAESPDPRVFRIGYMGHFDKDGFPCEEALLALRKLGQQAGAGPLELHVCGTVSAKARAAVHDMGLGRVFIEHGVLPHYEALKVMRSCDLLLLLHYETGYSKAIVPHKLYYYISLERAIWGIAEEDGEAAKIISRTRTGLVSSSSDRERVYQILETYHAEWSRTKKLRVVPDPEVLQEYNARSHAKLLADLVPE